MDYSTNQESETEMLARMNREAAEEIARREQEKKDKAQMLLDGQEAFNKLKEELEADPDLLDVDAESEPETESNQPPTDVTTTATTTPQPRKPLVEIYKRLLRVAAEIEEHPKAERAMKQFMTTVQQHAEKNIKLLTRATKQSWKDML